jgi:hypothetical protein
MNYGKRLENLEIDNVEIKKNIINNQDNIEENSSKIEEGNNLII